MRLGEKQELIVIKTVEFGVYLAETLGNEKEKEKVLLPAKQVPEGTKTGDTIAVFLYKDSEDRLIATTKEPKLVIGSLARCKVLQTGKIGAFLDWGLEKDLFLPFREQTCKVSVGDEVLVTLYIDKSERLCATMNVYPALENQSPYRKDSTVEGCVYQISERFGVFVAVDDRYSALIPKKDVFSGATKLRIGEKVTARVARVLEDGRLELAVREKGYLQQEKDADFLWNMILENGGRIDFSDKASPELIAEKTGMSKAQFKRAVGKLLKSGKIDLYPDCIEKAR